jgi:hypothetical protein
MRRAMLLVLACMCVAPLAQAPAQLAQRPASAALGATGTVAPPRSPRNANYSIDARLDARERRITASEVITWRNITTREVSDLQFHLYWNAWKNTRSSFMREQALAGSVDPDDAGHASIDVTSITVRPGPESTPVDVTGSKRFLAPDDKNPDDETVMAVDLPFPVAPGRTLVIDLKWTARVPRNAARTGYVGDFFFIAQWFPKLGVLEEDGWNCHQFHASTEFFSDYGVYDVRLTVPRGWTVGATGVERERRADGEEETHRYYQEDVHDFAWTASPDYVERRARFEHPSLPPVEMRLLLQPEHQAQAARHFDATRATLKQFGEWFGAYPYDHVTVVDPAYQSEAAGMEYPTLFTAGTTWLAPANPSLNTPEEVTVHEAGHQWWYGVVGSNEFEHAWMDEGLTTYAAARAFTEAYPRTYYEQRFLGGFVPWVFRDVVLPRETFWNRLAGYRSAAESDIPSEPSFRYHPRTGRSITYNKTALWLNTLERLVGWDVMQRAMAAYFDRYQFRHPAPNDFFNTFNEVAGRNMGWFFDEVYRSSDVFDYGVEELKSTSDAGGFRTSVIVRRYGEGVFPVEVAVAFDNGERMTEEWSGRERWKLYTYVRSARAVSAQIDPRRVLLLDVNYTNNSRSLEPKGTAASAKWALKWMVWLQDALLTWGVLV